MTDSNFLKTIDDLAYDILMCLKTDMPVDVANEWKLVDMLDGGNLDIMYESKNLRLLTEYFLDNGYDQAWNIGNMLVGVPVH